MRDGGCHGIRGLDDDTGEGWAVQPEIFEGSDTATIPGLEDSFSSRWLKHEVLFLDAEDGTVYPDPEAEPCSGDLGELRMPCRAESRECGNSQRESSIPRVLWKLE